ncbi:MAG: TRAP transporter small permease [Pseudomonadales bacterium]
MIQAQQSLLPAWLALPVSCITRCMHFVIICAGIVMALTFFVVVIVRYGFGGNLFAYEEWLMTVAFWMFFLGSAVATRERAHINADIVVFLLENPKLIWARAVLVELLELSILVVISYWGYLMCAEEIATYPNWQETIALKIPFLVPRIGIFFGFAMMALYSLLHLWLLLVQGPQQAEQETVA